MFFNDKVEARITEDLRDMIAKALKKDKEGSNAIYESESHYIRIAVIEKLRRDGIGTEITQK